jgi:hypothetical protein
MGNVEMMSFLGSLGSFIHKRVARVDGIRTAREAVEKYFLQKPKRKTPYILSILPKLMPKIDSKVKRELNKVSRIYNESKDSRIPTL